ncbi:MAG: hypothetical protein CSB44_01945 [Gammaproteobacteria bacterium]|nr:MAG: hypothetical protein CSB44_01945 [Gammaproteobacteria bacterium]
MWEQVGLVFSHGDHEHRYGTSRPIQVSSLKVVTTWKENIEAHPVTHFIEREIRDRQSAEHTLETVRREYHAVLAKPIRWAVGFAMCRYERELIGVAFVLALVFLGVLRWA